MECDCYNNGGAPLRVTRGNGFTVRVRVLRKVLRDGLSQREDIGLDGSEDIAASLVSRLGRRTPLAATSSGGRLLADIPDSTPCGSYGLEVTGRYAATGLRWRSMLRPGEFVDIVDSTAEATGVPESGVLDVAVQLAPQTLPAALVDEVRKATEAANTAAEKASKAAEDAAKGASGVDFMDHTATPPAREGQLATDGGGLLYEARTGADGALQWQPAQPAGGRIYVDAETAQSYVARDGRLVRLDRENSDLLYDVEQ